VKSQKGKIKTFNDVKISLDQMVKKLK